MMAPFSSATATAAAEHQHSNQESDDGRSDLREGKEAHDLVVSQLARIKYPPGWGKQ